MNRVLPMLALLLAILLGASIALAQPVGEPDFPLGSPDDEIPAEPHPGPHGPVAYVVGKVLTMDAGDRVINNAVVLVEKGSITAVGKAKDVEIPKGAKVVEMPDHWLVPGFVELHNHEASSLADLNDTVYLTNPGLRSLETIITDDQVRNRARAGGVTTALNIPGSGTNMGGFGTVVKYRGDTVEDMVVRSPGSIKIAQAGNPEGYWWGVGRMMMNYNTRATMKKAKAYHDAWVAYEKGQSKEKPDYNIALDGFRGLFAREYPASVHTQIYQVVLMTVEMVAKEFGVRTVLDHSTFDGWKVAPVILEVGEDNIITINGPRQLHFDRTQRKIFGNAHRWWQGGIRKLGINTDSPVIPQAELFYQASMACWYGWEPYHAIAGLTRVGAEAVMLEDRIGSIEVGKDADFGLWTGDPLDPRSSCDLTVINGAVEYDSDEERVF